MNEMFLFLIFLQHIVVGSEINYYLYTLEHLNVPVLINDGNLHEINKSKEFKYIIHGWLSSARDENIIALKDSYFIKNDYNVILVDWEMPAYKPYYVAVKNTEAVGKDLSEQIIRIGSQTNKTHLIGFSLGAHIAGIAGYNIRIKLQPIGRITGLDPAGPIFHSRLIPNTKKLDSSDANFVDVIHTNAGIFGYKQTLGTVDFFPNGGGAVQAGCYDEKKFLDTEGIPVNSYICSHLRSLMYFEESINSENFIATKCDSYLDYVDGKCWSNQKISMGERVNSSAKGKFFLSTNPQSPFARGSLREERFPTIY